MYNESVKTDMTRKEKTERDSKVKNWFKEGVSQTEIGERLGLTRQRVQQLEHALGLSRGANRSRAEYTHTCHTCGTSFTSSKPHRKYCSRECFRQSRIKQYSAEELAQREAERKRKNREKARHYYHNVFKQRPDWQDVVKERNKKYYAAQTPDKS